MAEKSFLIIKKWLIKADDYQKALEETKNKPHDAVRIRTLTHEDWHERKQKL